MNRQTTVIVFLLWAVSVSNGLGQSLWPLKLNEVKTVPFTSYKKKLRKYDAFVEVYNDSTTQIMADGKRYFLGTPYAPNQISLFDASAFQKNRFFRFLKHPKKIDGKSYKAYHISLGYNRKKTLRVESNTHRIYLSYWTGTDYVKIDSLTFNITADPQSHGRCHPDSTGVCDFNIGTPFAKNVNMEEDQIQSRTVTSFFVSPLINTASNTGFSDAPGYRIGWIAGFSNRRNKPLYFASYDLGLMQRGYKINTQEKSTTSKGQLTRDLDGYYEDLAFLARAKIGFYIYKRIEFYLGGALIMNFGGKQVFRENRIFEPDNGEIISDTFDHDLKITSDSPDFGFSAGLNYNLSPVWDIELQYFQSFSLFEERSVTDLSQTILFRSIGLGINYKLRGKPKTYKITLLK